MEINSTGFGYIIINGKKYSHDVIIAPDGNVLRRKKEISAKYKSSYGHTPLSFEELKEYVEITKPKIIIIGKGQYGALPLTPEANKLLKDLENKGVKVLIDNTPKIINLVNEMLKTGRPFLAIIHITC